MNITERFVTIPCCHERCGITFAVPESLDNIWRNDGRGFWCPNGHSLSYLDEASDRTKLKQAEARERHLQDQLEAAEREAENQRRTIIRERSRFANGVCPCCNRSFSNVRRHMSTQHPDYDVTRIEDTAISPRFKCSCGRSFTTPRGLAIHQGHNRREGWETSTSRYYRHVTVIS